MSLEIREATVADAKKYFQHVMRHFAESGADGDIVFHPMLDTWKTREMKTYVDRADLAWSKAVDEVGWERMWILLEGPGQIVGHVFLRSLSAPSSLHRSFLGIGMERHVRGGGWGRKLMETAIAWAREQASLEYVDLYVFGHNTRARALYKALGFYESEINPDQFRVGGRRIDDIHMVLKLR